jgi:hypothetical protein
LFAGGFKIMRTDQLADGQMPAGETGFDAVDQPHNVAAIRLFRRAQNRSDRARQAGNFTAAISAVYPQHNLGSDGDWKNHG